MIFVPTITSFTPTSAANGTLVTINGTNFASATNVKFGGKNAASFTIINDNIIVAVVGAGLTGAVTVTNPAGTGTLSGFTYAPASNCGCSEIPESCIPAPLIPVCDDPEYCEETSADKCIVHKGDTLTNLSAPEGTRLDEILATIDTSLGAAGLAPLIIAAINASSSLRTLIAATT